MIPVEKTKEIREELGLLMVVVFGLDKEGNQIVSTDGKSFADAECANNIGNDLKNYLEWPEELCKNALPERKCRNCHFWEQNQNMDEDGACCIAPVKVSRKGTDIACYLIDLLK